MNRSQLRLGASVVLLGLLVALAGSLTDNLLGDAAVVTVLQVVLWIAGGILMLAGAISTVRPRRAADRTRRRPRGRLRATHR